MSEYPKEWEKKVTLKNGQQVFLRPELSTDTERVWEMFSTLSDATLNNLVVPFTRERVESWTSNIDYDKNLPILALIKEKGKLRIIGSATLSFNSAEALKHKAELGITVHDNYQNMGLGAAMINHLLDIARKKGLKKVHLLVNTDNARAVHVYEKCGFRIEAKLRKERHRRGKFRDDYRMAIFFSENLLYNLINMRYSLDHDLHLMSGVQKYSTCYSSERRQNRPATSFQDSKR